MESLQRLDVHLGMASAMKQFSDTIAAGHLGNASVSGGPVVSIIH